MPLLRRIQTSSTDIEKRIVTGVILSDKILDRLKPILQPEALELSVSSEIVKWVLSYYDKYKKAPREHVKDLYTIALPKLQPNLAEEIKGYLTQLNQEYLSSEPSSLNEDFLIDRGIQYLKERHLRRMTNDINALLETGNIQGAEDLATNRRSIINTAEYNWVKPFDDPKYVNTVFEEMENPLFQLKGQLGELIGPLYRGYLIGIMGPMKRGKTWGLQDVAVDAMLSRKRVAFASLEMKDIHMSKRLYSQMACMNDLETDVKVPIFDCLANQDNSCAKPQRINHMPSPVEFDPDSPYRACTACRGVRGEDKDFIPTVWHSILKRPILNQQTTKGEIKRLHRNVGRDLFRLISYPAFTATLSDLENDLDKLESEEGFVPDVFIVDYADILAPESRYKDPRHQIDEIWKRLKGLGVQRSMLVATGSQSNRGSLDKDMLSEKDPAEEIRKLAHVDIWLSLDQTQDEKESGIWRIGILEHRWRKFNKRRQLMALQQFELGQPIMDGEIIYYERSNGD